MKKQNTGDDGSLKVPLRFVVLIPHRDLAGPLHAQSGGLFAAGMAGAFSFPPAAPIALVSRPFSRPELRSLAAELRESFAVSAEGKINPGPPLLLSCPGFHSFYGPSLDLLPPPLPYPGVLYPFPALALCLALIAPGTAPETTALTPLAGFRAAMVANLSIRPLSGGTGSGERRLQHPGEPNYSFTWRIGPPCWLPSPRHLQQSSPRNLQRSFPRSFTAPDKQEEP